MTSTKPSPTKYKLLSFDPKLATAYVNRGWAYTERKATLIKLSRTLRKPSSLTRNWRTAYLNRGWVYEEKGDFEKAIADEKQALRLNPKMVKAYSYRGCAYQKKGELVKALADCNEAVRF